MALKPGMQVDSRQGLIIGTTDKIDYKYIQQNPNPDPSRLKEIFIKEAECYCATSLDRKIYLPVGVDYINAGLDANDTCHTLENKATVAQVCLDHLLSRTAPHKNGVLLAKNDCTSSCDTCIQEGVVCSDCADKGHQFIEPSLRACSRCIAKNVKCIKTVTLVFSMDSESRNGAAQAIFQDKRANNIIDPHITLTECLPDSVHVGKRISRQFSNWFLIVDGYRINRVQLRTLRDDPFMVDKLREHLTVAACRNRDRMDVDSLLEISSDAVRRVIGDNVQTITNTIVPEQFRLYEGNKKGVLENPTAVCLGSFGTMYITDTANGKLFSARLHYPVDVNEICSSLDKPLDCTFHNAGIYIAEYGAGKLSCVDLDYTMIYNPSKMTVKQLRRELQKLNLLRPSDRNAKRTDLQSKLKDWIDANTPGNTSLNKQNQMAPVRITIQNVAALQPTAVKFNNANMLFVADEVEHAILQLNVQSNGVSISATVLGKVGCPSQTFGIAPVENRVYITSSDRSYGGILFYDYDRNQQSFAKPLAPPNRVVSNGTAQCASAHGLAVLSSDATTTKIVFTDVAAKKVKCVSLEDTSTVEILSGMGVGGQTDGANASFSQPTSCCTKANTIFVCDSASGTVRMITKPSGLLKYLENLNTFLKVFGVHRRDEPRSKVHKFSSEEAIASLEQVNEFFNECVRYVRNMTGLTRNLQGPDGVCSQQTIRDLELTINTVKNIVACIEKISPDYANHLDFASLTTLVVENVFAEMREGNDMPLVLQFAHRLSSTLRENLKRSTKCSFNYFTSSSSYYSKQTGFLPFSNIPPMPKQERNSTVTKRQLDEMRKWRAEFGQSVRQVTVRNKSTKDNPGRLPINCYITKPADPRPLDFANLSTTATSNTEDPRPADPKSHCFGTSV